MDKASNRHFFLLQVLFWAAYCVLFGYTVTIFGAHGYSAQVCGVVTTLQYLTLMVAQPAYGYIMDNLLSPKWFFIAMMTLGGLCALGLPWAFRQPLPVLVGYYLLLSLFVFSAPAVVDTWCITVVNHTRRMDFGLVRSGGSLSYALTGLVAGNIIGPLGIQSLFVIHVVLALGAAALALTLRDPLQYRQQAQELQAQAPEKASFGKALGELVKNRAYTTYTFCMMCYYFASRATQVYMPIILARAGGGDSHYGLSLFLSSGGEMLVMLLASRLIIRGVRLEKLYGVALTVFTLRFVLLTVWNNLAVMLAGQLLLAVGFGLQVRVHTQYLSRIAPERYQNTAILVCNAMTSGLGAMMGTLLGGQVIERWGVTAYLALCTGVVFTGLLFFVPTLLRVRTRERSAMMEFLLRQMGEERP